MILIPSTTTASATNTATTTTSATAPTTPTITRAPSRLLLLLIGDPSSLSLALPDLPQINPDSAPGEGVGLGGAPVLLIGGPEAADEGVEAAPGLAERAGAGGRRVRLPVKHAPRQVNLGLPKLVQVPEEL